jgi:hypothetical protein
MAAKYIVNHDRGARVLITDEGRTSFQEADRPPEIKDRDLERGFYVNVPGGFVGVVSSPDGPVLFINNDKYLLDPDVITITTEDKGDERAVSITRAGSLLFTHQYKKLVFGYDVWSSEEDATDFFLWLENNYRKPQFHRWNTH